MATEWKCVGCGASLESTNRKKTVCSYCGTVNIKEKQTISPGMIECVQCGAENSKGANFCAACGADLYFKCPKCGTINQAESVHCTHCGADIAQEIRNWQLKQAQDRAIRDEKRRKGRRTIAIVLAAVITLILLIFISQIIGDQLSQARIQDYDTTQTAWSVYRHDEAPFKGKDTTGDLELVIQPEWTIYGGFFFFGTWIHNNSLSTCEILESTIYAIDDIGNTYTANLIATDESPTTLAAGDNEFVYVTLKPSLINEARTLTIYYPNFCGKQEISITVDLTSTWLEITDHNN